MPDQVRLGFVGTGGIANHHLGRLANIEGVQIVALCDVVEERARESCAKWGGQAYTDYRAMLDKESIDGLYVCVPPFAHEEAEILAAQKGVHLFVEKPVVLDFELGLRIREAVEKAGIITSVGYGMRYSAAADAARKFLSGKNVGMVACDRWGGVPGGPTHWWRVMAKSGGQLHEMATHQVDFIRYLVGDITEVYKKESRLINAELENFTVPDVEVVTLQLANGGVGYVSTSCALVNGGYHGRMDIILQDHLLLRYSRGIQILPEGSAQIEVSADPVLSIDEAFVQAIRTGDRTLVRSPYADGLRSAAVSIAANQSAREGRPVSVPRV
jgi:predicted dehydrogenase